ncbi:MAG TPA: glycosyltransferase 87 family protein, partial [Anaerolineales bacterium]|nr:glycosyltransferase 87 family protein [Anaerolineales bacterium]
RTGYFELFTIAGIFLFRPSFSVIFNGQILSLLLLLVSVSILLFHDQRWLGGGLALSLLSLKPSIGLPILALTAVWLFAKKQWQGILGIAVGCITLLLVGMLIDPNWPIEYIGVSGDSFSKYFGLHPTLWGVVDKIFVQDAKSLVAGAVISTIIALTEVYILNRKDINNSPIEAFASILPAGLLIAPYSWSYDQILLAVPLIYLMIRIVFSNGDRMAVLFLFGMVALSISLVVVAYMIRHDVWSFLNSFLIWIFMLILMPRSKVNPAGGE